MSSPSITFGALKAELRAELFPTGEPYNLRVAHDKMFVEAIYDLQQKVDCFQINNTQVVPFCATKFQCGMTVFTAPRGRIWRVSTVDRLVATTGEESGSAPIQWCSEIIYKQVDYCRLEKFLDKQLGCSCSMWSQVPPPYCTKTPSPRFTRFPVPDNSAYADFPELPLGFIYPTPTTDVSCGRSKTGVWAQHSGRIYLAPWIQSTELILVEWDGIKRDWTDDDLLDDDAQLKKAIKMYVQAQRARDYDCDQQKYLQYRAEYEDVRSWLWWECEQETKLKNCEPRKSRWSEVTLEDQAPLVLPPDSGGTTSTTTNEPPPPPPTSTTSTTSEQPRGACCFEGPTCQNNLTRTLCEAAGGVYMGDYSVCVGEELELAAVLAVADVSGPSDVITPDLDAGDYTVVWTQGAYSFVTGTWSAHGISLAYGGGNTGNLNPPTYSVSAAAAEAFYNSIINSLSSNFTHTGGPMTLQLRDVYYGDNTLGDNPPVFAIYRRRVGCPPTTTTTSTPTTTTSTTTEEHRGACCVDGECIANVTLEQCNLLGGEYLNDGSTCLDDHTGNDHGVTIVCPTTTTSTTTQQNICVEPEDFQFHFQNGAVDLLIPVVGGSGSATGHGTQADAFGDVWTVDFVIYESGPDLMLNVTVTMPNPYNPGYNPACYAGPYTQRLGDAGGWSDCSTLNGSTYVISGGGPVCNSIQVGFVIPI